VPVGNVPRLAPFELGGFNTADFDQRIIGCFMNVWKNMKASFRYWDHEQGLLVTKTVLLTGYNRLKATGSQSKIGIQTPSICTAYFSKILLLHVSVRFFMHVYKEKSACARSVFWSEIMILTIWISLVITCRLPIFLIIYMRPFIISFFEPFFYILLVHNWTK